MNTNLRSVVTGMILAGGLGGSLAAQSSLYVLEKDGKYHAVHKVTVDRPCIEENGKLTAAMGQRFALIKAEEYLPICITVHDMAARATGERSVAVGDLGVIDTSVFNNEFRFGAKFESTDPLDDVFLVLELEHPDTGNSFVVQEIGRLEPGRIKPVSVNVPLARNLGPGRIKLHLFVGGAEVLHSEQPAAYREEALDRMIAKRIANVQQAGPKPFFGSAPEYPVALRVAGTKGEAVVTMLITPRGTVQDPVVARASDPAFGEAALVAVRQCRFLPRVENGRAVETRVSLPFAFAPPANP